MPTITENRPNPKIKTNSIVVKIAVDAGLDFLATDIVKNAKLKLVKKAGRALLKNLLKELSLMA